MRNKKKSEGEEEFILREREGKQRILDRQIRVVEIAKDQRFRIPRVKFKLFWKLKFDHYWRDVA